MALQSFLTHTRVIQRSLLKVIKQSSINIQPNIKQNVRHVSLSMNVKEKVSITFIKANGEKIKTHGNIGDSLLDVIVNNNIDFDGYGACEGTLTCSTCHLIFKPDDYAKLPNKPSDEELDMLDLAYDLTDTSRLGCQINLTKDMDGLEVRVPATIIDARET